MKYNADAEVPMNEEIRYGVLDNGLTYYILANKTPENRAEFFLINNTGAMQETPGQNGFAHLTEHMCFNGTKNFEKKDIIHYLESIGMKFGPEINAYTSQDRTIYTLNKVPIDTKENIDTSLMILYDWACNVSMASDEIEAERDVVREEFRTRMNAMFRMRNKTSKVLYEGSKYAIHDVIGTVDVIKNSPADTLRAYYADWYRPDLQAIAVVGDFDAAEMEAKVKEMFSKIPKRENPKKHINYEVPDHKGTKVSLVQDKEAQYSIVQIFNKVAPSEMNQKQYRDVHIHGLFSMMISMRMNEKTLMADPPYLQAGVQFGSLTRTKDAYITYGVASNTKIKVCLEEIMTENERVKRYGFLETELDRAKSELLSSNEKAYKERNKKQSAAFANGMMEHYLTNEPIPNNEWDIQFVREILSNITVEEVNSFAAKWITDDNRVIIIMAPEKEEVIMPTETEVLAISSAVKTKEIAKYVDAEANKPLIARMPTPGTIVKEEIDDKKGTTKWTLSNGVTVVMKKTDFKEDEILLTAYSNGGWSKVGQKDDISAKVAADVIDMSGIGEFNSINLQKKLSGKVVSISPYISELTEGFRGSSNVADFNTMLQLNYLYFTAPRADQDMFENYKKRTAVVLANKSSDPQSVFVDSLKNVWSQNHPRKRNMTAEMLEEAKLNRIKFIFGERFGDPSGFTYYLVGNIDPAVQKDTILKYLGGLPTVHREETWTDLGVRYPQQRIEKHFTREMETAKSTTYIGFINTSKKYTIEDRLMLEMVKSYLSIRYFETLREEIGGTYGSSEWANMTHYPAIETHFGIFFDSDPAKTDTMVQIIYAEALKIMSEPLDEKIIQNTAENKIKEYKENRKKNRYWLTTLKSDDFNQEDYANFDYVKFWESMTAKKVQKAAKKFLDMEKTIEVIQTAK